MTNFEYYKTYEAALTAYIKLHEPVYNLAGGECGTSGGRFVLWLYKQRLNEKTVLPCPFCGSKCTVENVCTNEDQKSKYIACSNEKCLYSSTIGNDESEAVRKHNELCLKASGNTDAIPCKNKVYGKYRILDALTDEPKDGKYFVLKVDAKSEKEKALVKATLHYYAELQRGAGNSAFADSIEDYIVS